MPDPKDSTPDPEHDSVELARRLVYLAAERTLTSWVRTALSLMALGFVIDRFDLILKTLHTGAATTHASAGLLSTWAGSLIIGLGAAMALMAGVRYLRFAIAFHREGRTGVRHGIYVGAVFAMVLAVLGAGLVVLLSVLLR
jgi:putative membrane protein